MSWQVKFFVYVPPESWEDHEKRLNDFLSKNPEWEPYSGLHGAIALRKQEARFEDASIHSGMDAFREAVSLDDTRHVVSISASALPLVSCAYCGWKSIFSPTNTLDYAYRKDLQEKHREHNRERMQRLLCEGRLGPFGEEKPANESKSEDREKLPPKADEALKTSTNSKDQGFFLPIETREEKSALYGLVACVCGWKAESNFSFLSRLEVLEKIKNLQLEHLIFAHDFGSPGHSLESQGRDFKGRDFAKCSCGWKTSSQGKGDAAFLKLKNDFANHVIKAGSKT